MGKRKPVILIVDDEAYVISSLKRVLMNLDVYFISTDNGEQGLKIFERTKVDLVISDLRMAGMDGIDFTTIVRRLYPKMLIIIMSARANIEDTLEAINSVGVHKFITKPWDEVELLDTVRKTLSLVYKPSIKEGCTAEERQWILTSLDDFGKEL